MTDWKDLARGLAETITESAPWRDAICNVPRHCMVPCYYLQNDDATWRKIDGRNGTGAEWLDTVYSNTTLVTALAPTPPGWGTGHIAVSSSTMPGLMISMLEKLRIRDGDRVLEIGTGTGYNAGILSHRLGSANVCSVDVDPQLVELARGRLAALGYNPTIVTRDGEHGLAEHAPYDRVVATCSVPRIPRRWIEQTTQGGLILTDFKPSGIAGNLVLLTRDGDTASGRFLQDWAGFMPIRHADTTTPAPQPRRDHHTARERRTTAPHQPWLHPVPWFLAQFDMPDNLSYGQTINDTTGEPDRTFLTATDGSWCEIGATETNGTRRVIEAGPKSLWALFEQACADWHTADKPGWEQLGLTITPTRHTIWIDHPDNPRHWSVAT